MIAKRERYFILILLFICGLYLNAGAGEVLRWEDCVREASQNHPDLISAEEEIRQSEASRQITASSLFPQITSSLTAQTAQTSTETAGGLSSRSTSDTYRYGVSGTQLVFDGLKTIEEMKGAAETVKANKQAFRFASSAVRLRLRNAFVSTLRAQEMAKVAQEIFEIRRQNFELITLRYESGLEHKAAMLTAEANLAQAQLEINQAKRDLEVAQRQLNKEMGRISFEPVAVEDDFEVRVENERPDFEEIAKRNPSFLQLSFQKNAARHGIRSAYAEFFPEISAQAGASRDKSRWPPRSEEWSLGLTLSLPIFEGGLRTAQVAQAKSLLRQLEADERGAKDTLVYELEQAWQSLQNSLETVAVQHKILLASNERSVIAEAQYSTGFLSYDNWTIIEDNLVRDKKAYLESRISALLAEADWIQAKGEVLEYAR